MNGEYKKKLINTFIGAVLTGTLFIVLLLHNAWGDERYELKDDAIRAKISRLDTELTVMDQEILFAESQKQKEKFIAIKAIYVREKEALREKLKSAG